MRLWEESRLEVVDGAVLRLPSGDVALPLVDGECPTWDELYRFAWLRLRESGVPFPAIVARRAVSAFFAERLETLRRERAAFERGP